jgi:hypothetical protein
MAAGLADDDFAHAVEGCPFRERDLAALDALEDVREVVRLDEEVGGGGGRLEDVSGAADADGAQRVELLFAERSGADVWIGRGHGGQGD